MGNRCIRRGGQHSLHRGVEQVPGCAVFCPIGSLLARWTITPCISGYGYFYWYVCGSPESEQGLFLGIPYAAKLERFAPSKLLTLGSRTRAARQGSAGIHVLTPEVALVGVLSQEGDIVLSEVV